MNEIKVKINFEKRLCNVIGGKLTKGDYNSTKIVFSFDRNDGRKVFEMINPSGDLVYVDTIVNNELILLGKTPIVIVHNKKKYEQYQNNISEIFWYSKEDNKLYDEEWQEVQSFNLDDYIKQLVDCSLFNQVGKYKFEVSLYGENGKLTSASGQLNVDRECVVINDELVEVYLPIFDSLITELNSTIKLAETLNLDVERLHDGVEVILTKKDGRTKEVKVNDGEPGEAGYTPIKGVDYFTKQDIDDYNIVQDENYIHTDNNFTTTEKNKLAKLNNYDDTELIHNIEKIQSVIPNQATSENKLADKNFVNSSIATTTSYFRGTYNSVAELMSYSGDKTINDYAFVIVYDEIIPSQVKQYDRYKYNGTTWIFEYTLNNSNFTAQQWETINSGITSANVLKILGIEDGAEKNIIKSASIKKSSSSTVPISPDADGNIEIDVSNKVDKELGKGLSTNDFTNEYKDKLENLDPNIITKNKNDIKDLSNKINRVEDNLFDSGQATGSSIKVEDSTLSKFKEISVDGVCKQTITEGYNLFDASKIKEPNIIVKDNGKTIVMPIITYANGYKTTNTPLKELAPNLNVGDTVYLSFDRSPSKLYNNYIYMHNAELLWNNKTYMTITQEMLDGNVVLYGNRYDEGETEQITLYNFMITKEPQENFEPYTGGQPSPSPDYPQPISTIEESFKLTSCNKNLLDLNKIIGTSIDLTNNGFSYTKTENADTFVASYEEYLKPNTSYFIHMDISHSSNALYIYEDKLFGKTLNYSRVKPRPTNIIYQFTTNNTGHAVIGFYSVNEQRGTTGKFEKIQLELDEPTDYEQHLQSQITANLPEGEFIGELDEQYKDTLKIKYNEKDGKYHLYLYKCLEKFIIDETKTISPNINTAGKLVIRVKGLPRQGVESNTSAISDYYPYKWQYNNEKDGFYIGDNMDVLLVTSFATKEEFLAFVEEHNITVIYKLTEPYEVDLGVIDMPLTYYPITHLFTDCDLLPTINAKYYRDFKNTIKTMQDNLTADNTKISVLESDVNTLKEQVAQLMTSTTSELGESEVTNNDI